MSDLQQRLTTLMNKNLKVPEDKIGDEVVFADLELDSLALIEFAVVLEKEFDVQIDDDEITPQLTIVDTTRLLEGKGAA